MSKQSPIAIVGVGAIYPGSQNGTSFWRDVIEGKDRLTDVPTTHWLREDFYDPKPGTADKVYATRGGFLGEIEFSPMEFGMPPTALEATDTSQLLGLLVAKRVLEDAARGAFDEMDRDRMSVILGVASTTELVGTMCGRLQRPAWSRMLRESGLSDERITDLEARFDDAYVGWQESTFPGLLGNVVAGRIANRLDLGGTNVVVRAAVDCPDNVAVVIVCVAPSGLVICEGLFHGLTPVATELRRFAAQLASTASASAAASSARARL